MAGANAVEVARQLIKKYGSLDALSRCSVKELAASRESALPKARNWPRPSGSASAWRGRNARRRKSIRRSSVYELLGPEMRALHKESLRVILLDTRYNFMRIEEVSLGSVNESIAHPRDVFRPALIYSAYAVVVVHNHPSGDPSPSQADHSLTRRLREAAELLQIKLLDHVIIGAPAEGRLPYFSFKEMGVL